MIYLMKWTDNISSVILSVILQYIRCHKIGNISEEQKTVPLSNFELESIYLIEYQYIQRFVGSKGLYFGYNGYERVCEIGHIAVSPTISGFSFIQTGCLPH